MVLLASLAFVDGADAPALVALPRYHHQYLPDILFFEAKAFDGETVKSLAAMGHAVEKVSRDYGDMQAITWNRRTGALIAASDPRGEGQARLQAQARRSPQEAVSAP
jgi:gamma-glutamyltranspeptidase/glutathione hydrolase